MTATTAMTSHDRFLGTGWAFPPAFGDRQIGALMVDAAQDIEESLHILLSTRPGERLMHRSYGCDLHRLVFEKIDIRAITEIRERIETAVRRFEPRILLDAVDAETSGLTDGVLRLRLRYTIRTTNSRRNWVYPLYLDAASGATADVRAAP
jgi:uncharacterized protein